MGAFSAKRLVSAGLLKELGNMKGLDMNRAEPAIVNGTREVAPGLIMTGENVSLASTRRLVWLTSGSPLLQAWNFPSTTARTAWVPRSVR